MKGLVVQEINRYANGTVEVVSDFLAEESPLEISVRYKENENWINKQLSITMRTSGADRALALGFLFTEGIIKSFAEIKEVVQSEEDSKIQVTFDDQFQFQSKHLDRNFYASSSCGVCGKASMDTISAPSLYESEAGVPLLSSAVLPTLLKVISNEQGLFAKTGGIHAAFLFDSEGQLLEQNEDVGRHNALDKLIGMALQKDLLPLKQHALLLSGRASFELIQKAQMAGISFVLSIGAPSSLAVKLAKEKNMTLIGFLKSDSYNVYTGSERLKHT